MADVVSVLLLVVGFAVLLLCLRGRTGHGVHAVADAANGAQHAGKHIGFHARFFHIQPHQRGGLRIAAHGIQAASKARVTQ